MHDPQVLWSLWREKLRISLRHARATVFEQLNDLRKLLVAVQTPQGRREAWRAAQPLVAFAVAYVVAWSYLFIAAFLGAQPPPAPLFPPGAVLLCALILAPPRRWWLYLLAAFVIQVPILAYLHLPLWWNLVGFIPDMIEPILAVLLLRRYLGMPPRFASLREVSIYAACVTVAVAVGATIGAGVNAAGGEPYWSSWRTWFLGDTLTYLILAPTLLLWIAAGLRGLQAGSRRQYAEAILLYGGLLVLGVTIFDTRLFDEEIAEALIYLPVPLLLWAAVRFGPRGIASALSLVTVLAIPAVANAMGPFASVSVPAPSLLTKLLQLQLFLLVIGVPLLFLAALVQELKQANAALRASEERFRDVVEAQTELISRYLPDTTLTFVNEANCRSIGLSREQLLGSRFVNLLPESEREPMLATIQGLLAHPGIATTEHQVRALDGTLRWQQWVNRTILDEQGRVTELQGIGRDITERKLMEQALQASEARYRAAFESAATGMMLVSTDGHPLQVNRPMVEMLGYTEEELRARTFADFTYPDDLEPNLTLFRRAVAGEIDSYQLEKRFIHKQGHIVWGFLSAGVVRDAAGEPLYLVGQLEDITERKQLEQEREAARAQAERQAEQLDRVFEAMADGVTVWDAESQLVRTNAALRRLLALDAAPPDYFQRPSDERMALYEPRDAQGHRLPAEDWPATRALRGEVMTGSDAVDLHMRAFDGRDLVFTASAAPLRDHDGRVVGAVGILHDQTERQRLEQEREEARKEAERRAEEMDRVFAAMADGVAVFDQDGRHLRSNAAYQRLLGLDSAPSDYVQRPLHERLTLLAIRDGQGRLLAPEEGPLARALAGEVLAGERALDLQVRTLDGREVELRVSAAPIRTLTGELVGAVSIYRDVTESKRLERALAEQAEQLDRIFEGIADGLVVYDAEGQVIRTNAAAVRILGLDAAPAGYAQVSAHGRAILFDAYDEQGRRLAPEEWPLIRVLTRQVDGADARDVWLRVLDGREVVIRSSAAPLLDGAGRLVGAVSILIDQTEQRRLEREREEARAGELALREVNERLDTFVMMAAHDLRTPVAVSRMVVQRALQLLGQAAAGMRPEDGKQVQAVIRAAQALATTEGNLDRLWRLVQQLLDVSRVREGTLVLNCQPTDLAELVRTCVEEQRLLNPSRAIELILPDPADTSATLGNGSIGVNADADRLSQVVTNYLSNAERYSAEDQPISVTLRLAEEEVPGVGDEGAAGAQERRVRQVARVEVRDQGVGVAEEDQATIWNRFQRATSVHEASGLGLGLYIARTIVELHGGQVGVESALGQGSTFWFTIPLLAASGSMDTPRGLPDDNNATPWP